MKPRDDMPIVILVLATAAITLVVIWAFLVAAALAVTR